MVTRSKRIKAKQATSKVSNSTKGKGKRSALRNIANQDLGKSTKNETKKKKTTSERKCVKNPRRSVKSRLQIDASTDDHSNGSIEEESIPKGNNNSQTTRSRRASKWSEPQVYKEMSSDEEGEQEKVMNIQDSSNYDDDDNYSIGDNDNEIDRCDKKEKETEKDKKQNLGSPKSSRFSLPSLDNSFHEPIRDWRTEGAIDY